VSIDPRTPCIIGIHRHTWHAAEAPEGAPEPLLMWEQVARAAAEDAGAPDALSQLDGIDVVFSQSWQYDDPTARLAERLGATPKHQHYSGIGGSVPQVAAATVAGTIAAGEMDLALIVGAEALATVRRLKKAGEKPQWSFKPAERRPFPMDMDFLPSEISHSVFEAFLTFALFDNARRAHLGRSLDEHRLRDGQVLSALTEVAAASPHAWFPTERSAAEISTASAQNRMVAYPYTKLMTSIMDVDMAAGLLLASTAKADALGVPADQRVYLKGFAYAEDPVHVAGHGDLWRSPAMAAAAQGALSQAGIEVGDVAHLDLYSCFASSVCFALDALGVPEDDARPFTQTGGLPYHGGPGSNYMTHSIAAMVETLRRDPGSFGLTTGVGMHMQKHAYGVWSTNPDGASVPPSGTLPTDGATTPVTDVANGPATVATYAVMHGRDGGPESALLVCDLPDGSRCYAKLDEANDAFALAESQELIGQPVSLASADGINLARLN
jgi:acetyl-CoA C-acetyltransferase